jgi:hypothetical protein
MKSVHHIPSPPSPSFNSCFPQVPLTVYPFYCPILRYPYFSWCSKEFLNVSSLWVGDFFGPLQPLPLLSLTPSLPPPFSTAFSTHPHILHLHRCDVLWYHWCSVILSSFPSFPSPIEDFHCYNMLIWICTLKTSSAAGRSWLTPVIPATQEAEIRKIEV